METKLILSIQSLYPIMSQDDHFHLMSDASLFSNLIATSDFSRVMSKLQLLKLKKEPLNMMFSIKTYDGHLPVLMHGEYMENAIYVTLYDLNRMEHTKMKEFSYTKNKYK